MPDFKPKSFLDFGAGLGAGSQAFADTFLDYQTIVACEPATPMRKLGKHLSKDLKNV